MQFDYARGACAAAAALEAPTAAARRDLLSIASRSCTRLERVDIRMAPLLGRILRAAVAAQAGRPIGAATLLASAAEELERLEVHAYAAAARARRAHLLGEAAAPVLPGEGLAVPDAFVRALAPGFPE
jgi:hypothetical protein